MKFLITIILLFISLPAIAGNILEYCNGGQFITECPLGQIGKPLRFNTTNIKLRIDPKLRHRKIIKNYVLNEINTKSKNVKLIFDGYTPSTRGFEGIYITIDNKYNIYGYASWTTVIEHGDYAESISAKANLTKWVILNNKYSYPTEEDIHRLLIIALHEVLHTLGIAHNNDETDIMHSGYNEYREWQQHSIDTLDELYSEVGL